VFPAGHGGGGFASRRFIGENLTAIYCSTLDRAYVILLRKQSIFYGRGPNMNYSRATNSARKICNRFSVNEHLLSIVEDGVNGENGPT